MSAGFYASSGIAETTVRMEHEAREGRGPFGIYADWIRRLRVGKEVPALPLGSEDPLARIGQELQLLAEPATACCTNSRAA